MTTYATTQNFIDTFGDEMIALTNLNNASAVAVNVIVLQANQRKAYALINGMIARCPDVARLMPFTVVPELLVGYELDLTRYFLDLILPREDVRKRYEDALTQLKLIGDCKLSLGLIGVPEVVQEQIAVSVGVIETPGIFTTEVLHGY